MVTYWVVSALALLARGIFSLIPDIPVPSWLSDQSGVWGSMLSGAQSLSAFVDVQVMVAAMAAIFSAYGVGLVIKLVRMIISHVTGGGGAT